MLANENSYINKAYDRLTTLSADEEKRLEYEAREKAIRDYNWQMESNWKAGHKAGILQGINQGVEMTQRSMVLRMIKRNMTDEDICSIAECTPEYVEELRKECNQE